MVYDTAAVRLPGSNTSAQYVPLDETVPETAPPCCTEACDVGEQTELLSEPTASPTVLCGVRAVAVTVTVPAADAVNVCRLCEPGEMVPENVSVVAAGARRARG